MRWKAIAVGAVLSAAFIATIVQQGSYGFARGGVVTDHATNSQHQILSAPPAANRVVDPPETEPWGPFRTTDW